MTEFGRQTADLFDYSRSNAVRVQAGLEITRPETEAALNELVRRALTGGDATAWMHGLFSCIAKMRHYSVFNANLIYLQRPGAAAVGTWRYWAAKERSIRPGAMPIIIFAPKGPYVLVYEYEDTEGREGGLALPGPDHGPQAVISPREWDGFRRRAEVFGRETPDLPGIIHVIEEGLGTTRHGDVHYQRDAHDRFIVRINQTLAPDKKWLTLVHELGHVFCGHMGHHPAGSWSDRRWLPGLGEQAVADVHEFEAEAVAWLLATRAGIRAGSPDYLADRVRRMDAGLVDIAAILTAANRIEPLTGARLNLRAAGAPL